MQIDVITDVRTTLGESPQWDADHDRIYWVDSLGRSIFRAAPDGGDLRSWDTPANIGSIGLRRAGGLVGAMKTGVHLIQLGNAGAGFDCIAAPEPGLANNTLNDGKVDRRGRFWFGSMDVTEAEPSGSLFRLDPDLSVHRMLAGVTVSNGPCWSPDGATFYFADSAARTITAFDFDLERGGIGNPRQFLRRAAAAPGTVDGATVDAEGYVWTAHVYGGTIARYAPDGTLDREIAMPTSAVTSVMFGGADLDLLFVTSMTRPPGTRTAPDGPAAGALFVVSGLGVKGLAEPKFAG